MKHSLLLVFLIAGTALAGDIEHSIRSVTNGTRVTNWEIYTRNGSTNLLRETDLRNGSVGARVHRVCHSGQLAASILWMTNGYFVLVETGQTVQVSASFHPDGELDRVMLQTQDGRVLDLFTATNGVLYPAGDSEIKEANECSRLVQEFVNTLPGPEKK